MERRDFLRGLFGFALASTALAALPIVSPANAAPLPEAPEDLDRALDEAAADVEDGAEDAEFAQYYRRRRFRRRFYRPRRRFFRRRRFYGRRRRFYGRPRFYGRRFQRRRFRRRFY